MLGLHQWEAHEHPTVASAARAEPGNGLPIFLRVDDFDEALSRAGALVDQLDDGPEVNPATGTRELPLRDPDNHDVMVGAPEHGER